jgi:hypothetical protein
MGTAGNRQITTQASACLPAQTPQRLVTEHDFLTRGKHRLWDKREIGSSLTSPVQQDGACFFAYFVIPRH